MLNERGDRGTGAGIDAVWLTTIQLCKMRTGNNWLASAKLKNYKNIIYGKGFLLTLRIVEAVLVVVMGVSVRGFLERGSSLEGSSALFFKPTTSAGGVVNICMFH